MEKFFDYFDSRHRESILNKPPVDDGPVITISRLTGCDARLVAAHAPRPMLHKLQSTVITPGDFNVLFGI